MTDTDMASHQRRRVWRRFYYDGFSRFYDIFIRLHTRRDDAGTRSFLVEHAALDGLDAPLALDLCCGTGGVLATFADQHCRGIFIGCDFSRGMLRVARCKTPAERVFLVQGHAAHLPFADGTFHAVSCSHALYELKGIDRTLALLEMKRVVRRDGVVLIMEHEVPTRPLLRLMFRLRLAAMGSADAAEFVSAGLGPFQKVFQSVTLRHTLSGKSRLICCRP